MIGIGISLLSGNSKAAGSSGTPPVEVPEEGSVPNDAILNEDGSLRLLEDGVHYLAQE